MIEFSSFEEIVMPQCDSDLLYPARTHALSSYNKPQIEVWVRREDDSSFGISGCKRRKYASLLPYLKQNGIKKVVMIGGSRSNHIAGFLQLLNENKIESTLLLKEENRIRLEGNRLLLSLLSRPDQIKWARVEQWEKMEQIGRELADQQGAFFIPEGGSCAQAWPGSCSLGMNLVKEAKPYDHIWIDAGTGLVAGSLIEVLAVFQAHTSIHVVQMADDESYFEKRLKVFHDWMEEMCQTKLALPENYELIKPVVGKSFGSLSKRVLREIQFLAKEEGILTDPVYTGKLFLTAKEAIHQRQITGKHLIIHSGGGMGLMGFGDAFAKLT
ncbi:MAG: pyridoxal-phosphate dependent enzyme [Bacteroidota bacterium]